MKVHRPLYRLLATTLLVSLLGMTSLVCSPAHAQGDTVLQAVPTSFTYQLAPFDSLLSESILVYDSLGQSVNIWTHNNSNWLYLDTLAVSPLYTPEVIPFTVIATGLAAGTYVDTIFVWGEGAINSLAVPVTLTVQSTDKYLQVSPPTIAFSLPEGVTVDSWFYVSEASGDSIPFDFSNSQPWLGLPLLFAPVFTPDSIQFFVNTDSLPPGTYADTIFVYSNQAVNSPQAIPVFLTVTSPEPPDLHFSPYLMNLKLPVDDTVLTSVSVWSSPSNGVPFWMSTEASWIVVNESATYVTYTSPPIHVSSYGLAPGVYHDTVFFHTDSLTEPTEHLPITLTVFEGDYSVNAMVYRDSWTMEEGQNWVWWDTLNVWSPEGATVNFTIWNASTWLSFDSIYTPGLRTPRSVTFRVDPVGLAPGTYFDTIVVVAATAVNPTTQIPVMLTITERSYDVRVQPASLDILLPASMLTYQDSLYVYEASGDTVEYLTFNRHSWLVVGSPLTVIPQTPSFLPLQFNIDSLPLGTYFDTVTIEPAVDCGPGTDCPLFPPVGVQISLTITNDSIEVIALETGFQYDLGPGESIDSSLTVVETHGLQLAFMVTTSLGSDWLQVVGDSAGVVYHTPLTVPFRVGPTNLPTGLYTDTLVVFDPTDGPLSWPEVKIPVVISVTNPQAQLVAQPNRFQYTLMPYDTVFDASLVYEQTGMSVPFGAFDTWQPHDFLRFLGDTVHFTPDTVWFVVETGNWPPGTYVDSILLFPLDDTLWYGNEYIKVELTIPEGSSPVDTLLFPSVFSSRPCRVVQPIAVGLTQPIKGASIPVKIPDGVTIDSISFDGYPTANWDFTTRVIRADSGFLHISLANSFGEVIPPGRHAIADLHFSMHEPACGDAAAIVWDTALMADPTRSLLFADSVSNDLAVFFHPSFEITYVAGYLPGDFSSDSAVTLTDLTRMINYLFLAGPAPCVLNALDVNGSCTGPNITDVTFLVDYLFLLGAPVRCGCLTGVRAAPRRVDGLYLTLDVDEDRTVLNLTTPEPLKGVELYVRADHDTDIKYLVNLPGLEVIDGRDGALLHIGILDIDGGAVIPAGTHQLFALGGNPQIVTALGSDMKHREVALTAVDPGILPDQFALFQNYPNPFNPSTEIRFNVPVPTHIELSVYNVIGQQIKTLVNEHRIAGEHTVIWDGTDNRGQEVATGIYLYRLNAENWSASRKMLLLK